MWHPLLLGSGRRLFSLVLLLLVTSGCAKQDPRVVHEFAFNTITDSPDIQILDYRYGNNLLTRAQQWQLDKPETIKATGIYAPLNRPDSLYVKWKSLRTQNIEEQTIDLRERIPSKLNEYVIYLIIQDQQIYIFAVAPERLARNPCSERKAEAVIRKNGTPLDKVFSRYCSRKITQIYPDL